MAAMLSKQGLGIVTDRTGDAKLYVDGFKAGVRQIPMRRCRSTTSSPSATVLAAAAAEAMLAEDADILTGTAQMVWRGEQSQGSRRAVVWHQANQTSLAPEIGLQPGHN